MRGRASVSIEVSDEERAFLEAQLRKHKAERSLSDRCRIVLRCVPGHGCETARCAGYAAILTPVAASGSRAFCSALI